MSVREQIDQSVDEPGQDGTDRPPPLKQGPIRRSAWTSMFHESLDTLILGTLSTSLGIVLILATLGGAIGPSVLIDLPQSTYFALVPIGTSIGVIGIVRARILKRFTSPLSTLGAVLCFVPAAPQILGSVGIYLLIMAPFAITFYGSVIAEKLLGRLARKRAADVDEPAVDDTDGYD